MKKLQELRAQAGLTQQQLSVRSGVTQAAISKIESGRIKDPTATTIYALACALDVSPLVLMGWEPVERDLVTQTQA